MRSVISVAALPISICPHAMSYFRPSSEMLLVSPVMACLVAVYGAELGRGACAEIDPLLMMRPPRGCCDFISADGVLRAQKRAGQVDGHHSAPLLEGEIFHRNSRERLCPRC